MKQTLLLFFILLNSFFCHAQNYQCLQAGVKHYFINGNGYLRGIRIDSVRTYADSTVYFPFRTPRGGYDFIPYTLPILDSNGGSWLGKTVVQLNDGTVIFDGYWNDSVVIKTQANIGDSWIFYSDSGSVYYTASVIARDTMTVLSALDSVKTIMINAYNSSGPVISDPLDSFNIILSKNNGFVQVFDLYTFPYHKPDSVYRPGLDFFLDRSTLTGHNVNGFFGNPPNKSITLFNLVAFINPNEQQLRNWNIGDVFEYSRQYSSVWTPLHTNYRLDTVVNKVVSGYTITYSINRTEYLSNYPYPGYTRSVSGSTFVSSALVYPFADTSYIPEQYFNNGNFIFYFPYDSSACLLGPAYTIIPCRYFPAGLGWILEKTDYKLGVEETHYYYQDGNPTTINDDLIYYNIAGIPCGSLTIPPTSIYNVPATASLISISPNPTTNQLTIKTTNTLPYTISLQNTLGQAVQTVHSTKQEQTINVSNIPSGVYNICITDENGNRYNEKVVIMH